MLGLRLRLAIPMLLAFVGMSIGCTPASLSMLLMPFVGDNEIPECPLAKKDKEVSVAVVCRATGLENRPELAPVVEQELSELVTKKLKLRYLANKDKVNVLAPSRVRPYLATKGSDASSMYELGKTLKADYVITMEVTQFSMADNSFRTLYRGESEIDIRVLDINKDAGDATVWTKVFKREYPRGRHMDAGDISQLQFRTNFGAAIAEDVSRFFAEYSKDEKNHID